jgi:hypothetical protein
MFAESQTGRLDTELLNQILNFYFDSFFVLLVIVGIMVLEDSSPHLPVLDVSSTSAATARELVDTISKYGFIYVKSDIISNRQIDSMFDVV